MSRACVECRAPLPTWGSYVSGVRDRLCERCVEGCADCDHVEFVRDQIVTSDGDELDVSRCPACGHCEA